MIAHTIRPRKHRAQILKARCTCNHGVRTRQSFWKTWPLTISWTGYTPLCAMYTDPLQPAERWEVSVALPFAKHLVALGFSFGIVRGAGACVLKRDLCCLRKVSRDAPAFHLINDRLSSLDLNASSELVASTFAQIRIELARIFRQQEAYPLDVNDDGDNLLHVSFLSF